MRFQLYFLEKRILDDLWHLMQEVALQLNTLTLVFLQQYFDTIDEAISSTKKGEIEGYIHFSRNFSKDFMLLEFDFNKNFSDDGVIHVSQDQTSFQKYSLIKQKLYEKHDNFVKRLMTDCEKPDRLGVIPIVIDALYGDTNFDFRITMQTGFLSWFVDKAFHIS